MTVLQDNTTNKDPSQKDNAEALSLRQPHADGIADKAGRWAFNHRDFFNSTPGILMFRNAMTSMTAWVPCITSFVLTRALYEKYEKFAAQNKDSFLTKAGKPFLSSESPVGRLTTFIFFGWFTYRGCTKICHRAFDRLFGAKSPEAAADVLRATPSNIIKDSKEIMPGGLAEVIPGSAALAAIQYPFLNKQTWRFKQGDFAMARKGWLNNTLATGTAYWLFTEICDHIYPAVTHGKDYGDYYRNLKGLPPKEKIPEDQKHYGFFTNEGAPRMLFRNAPAVLLGFAVYFNPYVGQRASYAKFGMPTEFGKTWGAVAKNWAKDYAAWALPFTYYTVISQVYRDNYDKLFEKLEKHAAARQHAPDLQKSRHFQAMVDNSRTGVAAHL